MAIVTETDVLAGVTEIVREHFGVSAERKSPPSTHLRNDLGADSIDEAEVAMQLEERFDLDIPDGAMPPTIREIVDRVTALLKAHGPRG